MTANSAAIPDVVVFGAFHFHRRVPLGDWQLARAFARLGARVLYVDPAVSPWSLRLMRFPPEVRRGRVWRDASSGVYVGTPFSPSAGKPWILTAVQERVVAGQARRWMRQLGFERSLLLTASPERGPLQRVPHSVMVYWQKDRQYESPRLGRPAWLKVQHLDVLRRADVVTAVSSTIVRDNMELGIASALVPNACDLTLFSDLQPEPHDLAAVPRPRIVFVGAYGWRVDRDLVRELAAARPDWSLILIGDVDDPALPPNVVALGSRDVTVVPAYLQHCDVGLVPYTEDPFNAACCPLKVYEYLAAGLPMVLSGVDVALDGIVAPRARDVQQVVAAVEAHLQDLPERRGRALEMARTNTWEDRAAQVLELCDVAGTPAHGLPGWFS